MSAMLSVPVRVPVAVGVNVMLIVQFKPPATELPQLFVCPKSPLTEMFAMFSVAVPVLVSVTDFAWLPVPTT